MKRGFVVLFLAAFLLSSCSKMDVTESEGVTLPVTKKLPAERKMEKIEILVTPPDYDKVRYEAALYIQGVLSQIGIESELKSMDISSMINIIRNPPWDYDIYIKGWGETADRVDPNNFLYNMLHSSNAKEKGINRTLHKNPEYDAIIEKAEVQMDLKARQKGIYEAQKYLSDEVGFISLYFEDKWQAYNSKKVSNLLIHNGLGINNNYTLKNLNISGEDQILKIAERRDIDKLNPLSSSLFVDRQLMDKIYDSLLALDGDNNVVPNAAESWEVVDDTTIDVVLQDGLTFHDGHPLTAEDVKFTYEFCLEWGITRLSNYIKPIESITIRDENTIRFKLKEPAGYFVTSALTSVSILPKHIWEDVTEREGIESPHDWANEEPIGSGPFKFTYRRPGEEIRLDAFKEYHHPVSYEAIIQIPFSNPDTIMEGLRNGTVDLLSQPHLHSQQVIDLQAAENVEVTSTTSIGFSMLGLNQSRAPFNDVNFRKALVHSIDFEDLVEITSEGYTTPGGAGEIISPANKFWFNPDLTKYEYDTAETIKILSEAGYAWDAEGNLYLPD